VSGKRVYRALLQLYPSDYRARFAAEMLAAFEEGAAEQRARGCVAGVGFALLELMSLLLGAGAEWGAKFTCDRSTRGRCLPDWRMMRPPGVTREEWFG
jgi:hypothetical protein